MRRNSRYVAKFVIMLALRYKFILPILSVYKIKLIFPVFVQIALLRRLIYHFIIDNKSIQIIDKAKSIKKRTGEAGGKCKVTSASSDNVLAKVYSAMISRIYTWLYSIKLGIKFTDVLRS